MVLVWLPLKRGKLMRNDLNTHEKEQILEELVFAFEDASWDVAKRGNWQEEQRLEEAETNLDSFLNNNLDMKECYERNFT